MTLSFMITAVATDFDVELVASTEDSALLCALRKGGTEKLKVPEGVYERHVLGAWHFILVRRRGNSFETRQWHIPRYLMAREMALRAKAFKQFGNLSPSPIRGDFFGLITLMGSRDQLTFLGPGGINLKLPRTFVRALQADVPLLEQAAGRVKVHHGVHTLPKLMTPAGHPVESENQELVEAVAFEKASRPRMGAGNFGIFSAYCTCRDFDTSIVMPEELIRELVTAQFELDPKELPDEDHQLFLQTQEKILPKPIWGRGINMTVSRAVPLLAQGMSQLTRTQRVQFILMNGMHGAGLFLPLATVLGLKSFESYADRMCQHWPPSDLQEQDRRQETAYIRLYGELANG